WRGCYARVQATRWLRNLSGLLSHSSGPPPHHPSFPTRRSSDIVSRRLSSGGGPGGCCASPAAARTLATSAAASRAIRAASSAPRSEEHTSELQSLRQRVCRLLLEKKKCQCHATHQGACRGVLAA